MGAARDVAGLGLDDDHGSPASVAVLGDSKWWPPGFRFHPTDEELVLYYLKRKVCGRRLKLPMIGDVDVYKLEPWELPDKSVLKNGDKQWYFFSPRDRKYPKGSRSNRATDFGYWKATGKDRIISQKSKPMGNKKTLVYYHGRAPKGERTDWVMHEYTLDEQMLSTCDNVQDSYALYKVFRKSGPGPKNGEQYGAPFKEEEWDDDEVDESFGLQANVEFPVNQQTFQSSATGPPQDLTCIETPCDAANYLPTDELEDLLLKLSDEQDMAGQHPESSAYISEIDIVHTPVGKRYSGLPLTNASSFEDDTTWCEMSNLEDSFEISERDFSLLEPVGNPEMTSLTYNPQQTLQQPDEEFLEIKDFNEPQSIIWRDNDLINTDQINGPVGLYDSFDYFDAPSAFADNFGPVAPVDLTAQHSYFGEFAGEGILNQSDNIWTELWDHDQGLTNPATTNAFAASQTSGVVHASTSTNLNQVFMASPISGVAYASISSNIERIQGQNINAEGTSGSWLSSTLSNFLDSIPSRPALASENAFISRALERVSSFRGGQRFHAPNTATGGQPSTPVRRGGRNGGFLFISFLVGIGAIFWVLTIGASVKLFKGFLARLNSS